MALLLDQAFAVAGDREDESRRDLVAAHAAIELRRGEADLVADEGRDGLAHEAVELLRPLEHGVVATCFITIASKSGFTFLTFVRSVG